MDNTTHQLLTAALADMDAAKHDLEQWYALARKSGAKDDRTESTLSDMTVTMERLRAHLKPMVTITCVVNDRAGAANPLIYTVEVPGPLPMTFEENPSHSLLVLEAVTKARQDDFGSDDVEIELIIAFAGEPKLVRDWRA